MIIQDSLKKFGDYVLLMRRVFTIPDRWREFFKRYISEIYKLGIDSIPIVITISVFIGAVIAIQMQKNVVSPMIPAYAVGLATRDVILLEFSSSILCLILAGKVGSNIASEIGNHAGNRANRRTRNYGRQLCQPVDITQNRGNGFFHSGIGRVQYGEWYYGWILDSPIHRHNIRVKIHLWTTKFF